MKSSIWKSLLVVVAFGVSTLSVSAQLIVLENFEDVDAWTVGVGSGAVAGSLTLSSEEAQVGNYAARFTVEHSPNVVSFDFVQMTRSFAEPFDYSDPETVLSFYFKSWGEPQAINRPYLTMRLTSTNGGFMEHTLHSTTRQYSTGDWVQVELTNDQWGDFGTGPDMSSFEQIRFQSVGDSSTWEGGEFTYYFDQIVIPEPGALGLLLFGGVGLLLSRRRS